MEQTYIIEIKYILEEARKKTFVAINTAMIEAYWLIGKRIVEEEQKGAKRATYGEALIKELSKALSGTFGRGFSVANLKNFRQFFLNFPEDLISYSLSSQLTWTYLRVIMRESEQIFAAKYLSYLPSEAELIAEIERSKTLWLNNTKALTDSSNQNE